MRCWMPAARRARCSSVPIWSRSVASRWSMDAVTSTCWLSDRSHIQTSSLTSTEWLRTTCYSASTSSNTSTSFSTIRTPGCSCTPTKIDSSRPENVHRELPWMDARRVRLPPADVRRLAHRDDVRSQHRRGHGRDHAHADVPPNRRADFWVARRPLRAPHAAHDRHCVLLGDPVAYRILSELYRISRLASALRRRHGRRVGPRCGADDGGAAAESPGLL